MKKLFLFALFALTLAACSDDDNKSTTKPKPQDNDKYQGGFYVLNEGSGNASINYYDGSGWQLNLFQTNNPDQKLGITGTEGVCSDEHMYVVTKMTPFLVEIGMDDFVVNSTLDADLGLNGQARGFALIDDKHGVLTASTGAFLVNLNPLSLGDQFCEVAGAISEGSVCVAEGSVFLIAGGQVKVYDAKTLAFKKDLGAATIGFARTGGNLWAANGTELLKIDLTALSSETIDLGDDMPVYYNSMAYTPSGLQASKKGDALYFAQQVGEGWSIYGRDIYKYDISKDATTKFFTAPDGYVTYGAGVNVNPSTGDVYLVYKREGWGENSLFTDIYVTDSKGVQKAKIPYTSEAETVYWFPSMLIFR